MSSNASGENARHWQAYWRGANGHSAAVSGDAPGDLFDSQWRNFFSRTFSAPPNLKMLDIACGAGVVLERAAETLAQKQKQQQEPSSETAMLCGLDYASAAVAAIMQKRVRSGAQLSGVAASAHALPFPDSAFNVVVSQFGIEYAGMDAFGEAARILSPGGVAQFITHYKDGGIYRECAGNAATLNAVLDSDLFDTALAVFREADPDAAATRVQSAVTSLAPLLDGEPLAAKQMLSRLLPDVTTLVTRRRAYAPDDAAGWLQAMHEEVRLYAGRMNAMTGCAVDAQGAADAAQLLASHGAIVADPAPMTPPGKTEPAAWLITAGVTAR